MSEARNYHASAVAFGPGRGVLILGPSGAGKSRLALALLGEGAQLVADDQVILSALDGALFARPPRPIEGMIEARGLGLMHLTFRRLARVVLVVDLGLPAGPRLPEPATRAIAGVTLPCLRGTPDTPFARAVSYYIPRLGMQERRG